MNFFVITNADTVTGRSIVMELARQKRNLILLGVNKTGLEELKKFIKLKHSVHIHSFEFIQSNRARILELCEFINDHFFVENLIDIIPNDGNDKLNYQMTTELDQQLSENLILPLLVLHQLMPNLMLCAEAKWIRVINNSFGLDLEVYRFLETEGLLKVQPGASMDDSAVGSELRCKLLNIKKCVNGC